MLQGFHWESHEHAWWSIVQQNAGPIADAGFDMVWLPPSSRSADAAPEGYLPNELYTQNSAYGSQAELSGAISALHSRGVKVLADIVINHRVGTYDWADFTNPTWGADAVCQGDEWPYAAGAPDTGDGYSAARDIDHTKAYVQSSLTGWMNWLKGTIGYDGWRYDYVKGYAGGYVGQYNQATSPYFSVGELWTTLDLNNPDAHRQQIMNWINATGGRSAAFDFTTKGILQQAVAYGEYWRLRDASGGPSGAIGWWPERSVTFLDNHDTGPSTGGGGGQNHWPFPSGGVMQGYAYILTHPGVPSVYWVHYFDWGLGAAIDDLIAVRKSEGITSASSVNIVQADSSVYAALIDDKVAVKIGPGSWNPGAGWTLRASGTNYAVWSRATTPPPSGVRTVIYMLKATVPGEDIYIRGGHDGGLVSAGHYPAMDEGISYLNTLNPTTLPTKSGDTTLDWFSDSALDWTCASWPASWGPEPTYATNGYGTDPENTFGLHYWKFDVSMSGQAGDWFEFKAFLRRGSAVEWEGNISQAGTPYSSINHWAKKGYITVVTFGQSGVTYIPLP
ncbi:MAG: alpha-amylase [Deltaproteobacteria bacterium]|nr:alpha-amylase [Deltaproteobacteria bacterium]